MSKIVIIGAGVGGLSAAIKLGDIHEVEIFEKNEKGSVGWDWYDDVRFDMFEKAEIPPLDARFYTQKGSWLFVSPDGESSIPVPPAKPMEEISVSRRGLADYLLNLAEQTATVHYGTPVQSLVVDDDAVKGIVVGDRKILADLVIDASGFTSPFREQVPDKYRVQVQPTAGQTMYAYRAFYKFAEGAEPPKPDCTLYVKHLGGVGISWCNRNPEGLVDVLIGRIGGLSEEEIAAALADLKARHPMFSDEPARPATRARISVRYPLSRMVADGYVAIGDSAFMTMPIMGSGIESSLYMGHVLAKVVKHETEFTSAKLWQYQEVFFDKFGEDYVFVDILKNWLLSLDIDIINRVFGSGLVTDDDLALISTDGEKVKIPLKTIFKKLGIALKFTGLVFKALPYLRRALKAKRIAGKIPEKYDDKKVEKWQTKFDRAALRR